MQTRNAFILSSFTAGALLFACGCGPKLRWVPAAGADRVSGVSDAAWNQVDGVRTTVRPDHWHGDPPNLPDVLTPVNLTVQNNSGQPLVIRYRDFTVTTGTGFRSAALPPFRMKASVPRTTANTVLTPGFAWSGFYLAPWYSPFYGPVIAPWGGPWDLDGDYYTTYYTTWQESLPTADMLSKAIPEGVLANGGHISGFVYFQKVNPEIREVAFRQSLVNANTHRAFGSLAVPFVMEQK